MYVLFLRYVEIDQLVVVSYLVMESICLICIKVMWLLSLDFDSTL